MEVQQAASEAATTKTKDTSKTEDTMKGLDRVTTVDPKKHEQGLRLAERNHQNRKKLKVQKSKSKLGLYYSIGATVAVRNWVFSITTFTNLEM